MQTEKKENALRKRQLIIESGRKMFLWVIIASVVVSFAGVGSWFLIKRITYQEKVLSVKRQTVDTLKKNIVAAPKLADNIRVLEVNESLNSVKLDDSQKAVQVILDALPSENNPIALGASIQRVLIGGASNVSLDSFSLNQSSGASKVKVPNQQAKTQTFSAVISSDDSNAIKDVLRRFEASIRTIDIDSIKLEQSSTRMTATVQGHAYYVPAKIIQLTEKTVPIDEKN